MISDKRSRGKLIRKIAKLDRAWRAAGKQEGKTENALAWRLGQAYRAGMGTRARQVQARNAARVA
jgi:hypothetical protein